MKKKLLAIFLSVCLILTAATTALAADIVSDNEPVDDVEETVTEPSTLTTDIGEKTFIVGEPMEFTFTTTAGSDEGKMVVGTSNFSDTEAIEKLEYYEVKDENWYELTEDFGPSTGFPMADATSKFRVTFKKAGDYTFTASMKEVGTENILCETEVAFTVNAKQEEINAVAQIGEEKYESLEAAVAAAEPGDTVTLLASTAGNGIKIPSGSDLTIDFGGYTYTINGELVGSTGTETNGFQLLKGSNITMKDGTITSSKALILIQNYSNLTLEDMNLDGSGMPQGRNYVLSNNCGDVALTGDTSITAAEGNVAFDVYYWVPNYAEGVQVTVNTTGTITGPIEYTASNKATAEDTAEKSALIIKNIVHEGELDVQAQGASVAVSGGTFSNWIPAEYCESGFAPVQNEDGTYGVMEGTVTVTGVAVVDGEDGYTPVTVPEVGQKLTANIQTDNGEIGSYPVNPDAQYKWYYEGSDAVLGTEPTYTVTSDNFGKVLCVDVSVKGYNGEATWTAEAVVVIPGDVNRDGVVDLLDLIQMNNAKNGTAELDAAGFRAADMDEDGAITLLDLIQVNKIKMGK